MIREPVGTRFAPSPTGQMHLGNARTGCRLLPDDVLPWVALLAGEQPVLSDEATGLKGGALFKPLPEGLPERRLARFA